MAMAAHHEITLDVQQQAQAEEEAANNPDSDSETILRSLSPRVAKFTTVRPTKAKLIPVRRRPTKAKFIVRVFSAIEEPVRLLFHWKKMFVVSCVFAVLLDPLFLYIPLINHDINCLGMDKKIDE